MKRYIDCDGVILNTIDGILDDYHKIKKINPKITVESYIASMDWKYWIDKKGPIEESLYLLRNYNPKNIDILTRVYSTNEAIAKIEYFRTKNIKNNIIIVPCNLKKTTLVNAKNNILVDDGIENLDDFRTNDGIPVAFRQDFSNYPRIDTLDDVLNDEKVKKFIR